VKVGRRSAIDRSPHPRRPSLIARVPLACRDDSPATDLDLQGAAHGAVPSINGNAWSGRTFAVQVTQVYDRLPSHLRR
jgi:hypothetical protein